MTIYPAPMDTRTLLFPNRSRLFPRWYGYGRGQGLPAWVRFSYVLAVTRTEPNRSDGIMNIPLTHTTHIYVYTT